MADNEHRTKHKNTARGILKRAHDSSVSKEDDDNPIKSILKKSKKQKLDSFTEVGPKLHSVLSAKTSSRIASQVTLVNEQKTPSKNDKATTGASPKKSPSEKKQTEANMINKETKPVINVSPSKTDPSKVSGNENKPIVQKELDKDEVLSEKREKRNDKREKENKMKKEKVSQDHESKLSIKKQSPSKDKSVKVELKVDEQDEEDEDDDEIGIYQF